METLKLPAVFIPHQGFTDIFNSLAHIDYYLSLNKWSHLYIIIREDAKDIVDFYTRDKNVICIYKSLQILDGITNSGLSQHCVNQLYSEFLRIEIYDTLFLGFSDRYCTNSYKDKFKTNTEVPSENFVKRFYIPYGLKYDVRYSFFNIRRNYEKEEEEYTKFIKKYGEIYSLCHSVDISNITKNSPTLTNCININQMSSVYFNFIKILENAHEFHFLDSSWAIFAFLLQCKYDLFSNKKFIIYCRARSQYLMFTQPEHLNISFIHMY